MAFIPTAAGREASCSETKQLLQCCHASMLIGALGLTDAVMSGAVKAPRSFSMQPGRVARDLFHAVLVLLVICHLQLRTAAQARQGIHF